MPLSVPDCNLPRVLILVAPAECSEICFGTDHEAALTKQTSISPSSCHRIVDLNRVSTADRRSFALTNQPGLLWRPQQAGAVVSLVVSRGVLSLLLLPASPTSPST